MHGSPESIPSPPPGWNESAAFRETTLRLFTQPEDLAALRHVGEMFHDYALELCGTWPDDGLSATRSELRAAAADLRHLQGFLFSVYKSADESELSVTDDALARFAGTLAGDVARAAEAIEREL